MESHWFKYKHDEAIGPLLASYAVTAEHLDLLKRDLRTSTNIDEILEVSRRQVALKYKIARLVGVEEDRVFARRMSLLWLVTVFMAVLVAAASVAARLGWWH